MHNNKLASTDIYWDAQLILKTTSGETFATERTVTEIYLDNLELLGGKPQEQNTNVPFYNQQNYQQRHGGYPYPPSMEPQELKDMPY